MGYFGTLKALEPQTQSEDNGMNIAEEIHNEVINLPIDLQTEVLDFIQRLRQERVMAKSPDKLFPPTKLEDVIGCLRYPGPPKTVEEMDAGIAKLVRSEWQKFNEHN
jgi:hypothetical protein